MPFKSKSQQRFMFAAEARGDLPEGTAERWAHHTSNIKRLPEKAHDKKKKKKKHFVKGFEKAAAPILKSMAGTTDAAINKHNKEMMDRMKSKKPLFKLKDLKTLYPGAFMKGLTKAAEPSMSMEANEKSGWSIGDEMPGTQLRNNAETGQFQGKSYRTSGVQNENREMKQSLKQKAQTARGGKHYGGTISKGIAENRED